MINNMEAGFRDKINRSKEKLPTLYQLCKTDETLKEIVLKFRMDVINKKMNVEEGLLLMENMASKNELLNYNTLDSTEVVDIFQRAGIDKPENSVLSNEFLAEIKKMPRKDLAFGLLNRILNDEIKIRSRKNIMQSKQFSQVLIDATKRYQNNDLSETQIVDELIILAKDIKVADKNSQ